MGSIPKIFQDCLAQQKEEAIAAFGELWAQHGDLEERIMTWDNRAARLMVMDFEGGDIIERKALSALSSNKKGAGYLAVGLLEEESVSSQNPESNPDDM